MRRGTWAGSTLTLLMGVGLVACGPGVQELDPVTVQEEQQAVSTPASAGALRWARPLTGPGEDVGRIVADRDGGYLSMVNFTGSIDLGNGPIVAPGGSSRPSMALARYDVNGKLQWVKVFSSLPGKEGTAYGLRHEVDRERNIILFLEADQVDFGSGPVSFGLYLVKLDKHGRLRWLKQLPKGGGFLFVGRIMTDRDNNIALAGDFGGVVDFGRGPVSSRRTDYGFNPSAYVSKFSPEGKNLWTYVDNTHQSQGFGGAVDSDGNFFLCGTMFSDVQTEPYVLMVSPQGKLRWLRRLDGALGFAWSVATHGNRVVVAGTFAESFTFAGHTHTATPNGWIRQDAFIAAFTREGEERWAHNFAFEVNDIAMDQNDGVTVVGGYEAGSGDMGILGPLPGNPGSLANVYVAKFDRIHGERRWVRGFTAGDDFGSPGVDDASVAVTKDGRPAVMGSNLSTLTVGSEVWTAQGRSDVFLLGFER